MEESESEPEDISIATPPRVVSFDDEPAVSPASYEPTPTSGVAQSTTYAGGRAEKLLYPGAQISEEMGKLLIQSLTMKHGLTKAAVADILQLVRLHMPADCAPASYKSVHRFYSESNLSSAKEMHGLW